MEVRKILANGEMVIRTGEGIYFHALHENSMPLLISEEEGQRLMGEAICQCGKPVHYSSRFNLCGECQDKAF